MKAVCKTCGKEAEYECEECKAPFCGNCGRVLEWITFCNHCASIHLDGWGVYVGNNRAVRVFIRRLEQLMYGVSNGRGK